MSNNNVIAIDLAKSSFQVCVVNAANEELSNKAKGRRALENWLVRQKPSVVAMEACGSAHYWAKKAEQYGHEAVLLPPHFVKSFVSGHKTDKNDALAIAVAARQPNAKPVAVKSDYQLALQGCDRIRQHYQDELTATGNLIRGLLYEYGITVAKGLAALVRSLPDILEDAENGLPEPLRGELYELYQAWRQLETRLEDITIRQKKRVRTDPLCHGLMALEGVAEVNALGLYLALGETGQAFKNGRQAAACIGTTPKQHSTGGKTVLLGIPKKVANKRLRANLIQGAMSKVNVVAKKPPKTAKDAWLKALIERRGKRRAAVALANKTIRTAWAMLHYDKAYRPSPLMHG